jgi:ribosomal protein L16 Arg81 hydroxylase
MKSAEELFRPLGAEVFLKEFFSCKPLHLAGDRKRFADVLSWGQLNTLISYIGDDSLVVAKGGEVIDKRQYTKEQINGKHTIDIFKLGELAKVGAMVGVNAIHRYFPSVNNVCHLLERVVLERVTANAYAGWNATQGFGTHWDDHEVMVLQICGAKRWRLFEPTRRFPIGSDRAKYEEAPQKSPMWEGEVWAGDVLYVPRGWWHDACPVENEVSLHVTLGIVRASGLDFLQSLMRRLSRTEITRADVPRFAAADTQKTYLMQLNEVIKSELDQISLVDFFLERDQSVDVKMTPSLPFMACGASLLAPDSRILWLPTMPTLTHQEKGKYSVAVGGTKILVTKHALDVIKTLEKERALSLNAIMRRHAAVDVASLKKLLESIMACGFVALVE